MEICTNANYACFISVGSPTPPRDKANLEYISGCNPHLTSQFCGVELDLKSTS